MKLHRFRVLRALLTLIASIAIAGAAVHRASANMSCEGFDPAEIAAPIRASFASATTATASLNEPRIVRTLDTGERTCSSVSYRFAEVELQPGEAIEFAVPPELRGRAVQFVVLGHRQESERAPPGEYDRTPGLSSVQLRATNRRSCPWRYWGGSSSGANGAKFAEGRSANDPEMENLYSWRKYGDRCVDGDQESHEPLWVDRARVVSVGSDPVRVNELTIKVAPPRTADLRQVVFSPGTDIGHPETEQGRVFGGGQAHQGRFPGAVALGGVTSDEARSRLPAGWRLESDGLHIPLEVGQSLSGLELAIGDSHPDGARNRDGGYGTSGWSKLSVGLSRAGGETDWWIQRENVPPEGVILASPRDCGTVARPGDELVIRAEDDISYLMALRIGQGGGSR